MLLGSATHCFHMEVFVSFVLRTILALCLLLYCVWGNQPTRYASILSQGASRMHMCSGASPRGEKYKSGDVGKICWINGDPCPRPVILDPTLPTCTDGNDLLKEPWLGSLGH